MERQEMKTIDPVDLICPTYNNPQLLSQCISSISSLRVSYPMRIIVVNNGHPDSMSFLPDYPYIKLIQTGNQNLGWEGGLARGLQESTSEFVGFINDDIYLPSASHNWLAKIMSTFQHPEVAAVGPSTNFVMGPQNIWKLLPHNMIEVTYLIGFCMILRRKHLDEAGGVAMGLPGGDDLDLSIRLRKNGHKLVARRDVFVFHHGAVTGTAVHGPQSKRNGWNSIEMTERTDTELIRRHGFKEWFKCRAGLEYPGLSKGHDHEGDIVRSYIQGEAVLDLGCANNKSIPSAIGVDIVKRGQPIQNLNAESEADVTADVEKDLPFPAESQDTIVARHVLEHCIDVIDVMRKWKGILKHHGRLIVAVPDESQASTIPLNPEHIHAFTPDSLSKIGEACGLKPLEHKTTSSMSFVMVFEKDGVRAN